MVPPTRRKTGILQPRIALGSRTQNGQQKLVPHHPGGPPAAKVTTRAQVQAPNPVPRRPVRASVEVIVLSSDDDDDNYRVSPPAPKRKIRGPNAKPNSKAPTTRTTPMPAPVAGPSGVNAWDVEHELALAKEKAREKVREKEKEAELALVLTQRDSFQRELRMAKEKHAQTEELYRLMTVERDEAVARSSELEKTLKRKAEAAFPDASSLEDMISCEICTNKMWAPATLRCAHTFCESCLHGWFNATYTAHVIAHPQFLEGPQVPLNYEANRHDPNVAASMALMRRQWERWVPQPVYTCPTCRVQVKERPLEIFFLKDVVRKVTKVLDPAGREKSPPAEKRANRAVGGIWDGFFPNK